MSDTRHLEEQLAELQTQLAFQEDTIAALDAVVSQQQQDMLRMSRALELIEQRYKTLQSQIGDGDSVPVDKPPHY